MSIWYYDTSNNIIFEYPDCPEATQLTRKIHVMALFKKYDINKMANDGQFTVSDSYPKPNETIESAIKNFKLWKYPNLQRISEQEARSIIQNRGKDQSTH